MLTLDERTTRFRRNIKIPGISTQMVEQGLKMLRELYGERFKQVFAPSQVITAVSSLRYHSCFPCPHILRLSVLCLRTRAKREAEFIDLPVLAKGVFF